MNSSAHGYSTHLEARPITIGRALRGVRVLFTVVRATLMAAGIALIALMLAAAVVPRIWPAYRTFTVLSGSMEPTIPTGSVIVLRPTAAETLVAGDVITFTHPSRGNALVTHRISSVTVEDGKRFFLTKGDANAEPDAWRIPATGPGWKVAFHVPKAGYVLTWTTDPAVRVRLMTVLVVTFALALIVKVWRGPREQPSLEPEPAGAA
jgi:signal peptidase